MAILSLSGAYTNAGYLPFDYANCYSWAEYRIGELPTMWYMIRQAEKRTPVKGDLVLFYYEKSGLPHIAVVEYVFDNGGVYISESNMYHLYDDGFGIRYIDQNYSSLVGFYAQEKTL